MEARSLSGVIPFHRPFNMRAATTLPAYNRNRFSSNGIARQCVARDLRAATREVKFFGGHLRRELEGVVG